MTVMQTPKIKVMVVDDSLVIRAAIVRILKNNEEIEVVKAVDNGQKAVDSLVEANPDVIVLDIEMPVMDGITAIPFLLEKKPGVKILMCSTLSKKGADVSMKALSLGAAECLVKPVSSDEMTGAAGFERQLLNIVKTLGAQGRRTSSIPAVSPPPRFSPSIHFKPSILAIGSSTGGPQALFEVIKNLKDLRVPVVITQHMPKTFTTILAEHIAKNCNVDCVEISDGVRIESGKFYVAAGGYHMKLEEAEAGIVARLDDGPPENFCKPAVDVMLRSAVEIYGGKVLTVILTGMGHDGRKGAELVVKAGGQVIAQDQNTSVVWGMPGAVAEAGLCNEILPLPEIGPRINQIVS